MLLDNKRPSLTALPFFGALLLTLTVTLLLPTQALAVSSASNNTTLAARNIIHAQSSWPTIAPGGIDNSRSQDNFKTDFRWWFLSGNDMYYKVCFELHRGSEYGELLATYPAQYLERKSSYDVIFTDLHVLVDVSKLENGRYYLVANVYSLYYGSWSWSPGSSSYGFTIRGSLKSNPVNSKTSGTPVKNSLDESDLKINTNKLVIKQGKSKSISYAPKAQTTIHKGYLYPQNSDYPVSKRISKLVKLSPNGKVSVSKKMPKGRYLLVVYIEAKNDSDVWKSEEIKLRVK